MNYGLYLSASGVLTNLYRQDVFANNLANVETTAFKPHVPGIRQRDPESIEDNLGMDVSQQLLDRLGGGAFAGPDRVSFAPGTPQKTGNPLDASIRNEDGFFAVQHTDPNTGQSSVRLTRDGRFSLNGAGQLVTPSGAQVLDDQDQPITIQPGATASLDGAGRVLQNGQPIAQLQVATVPNRESLEKRGDNLFAMTAGDTRQPVETPRIQSGFVEGSGVDPIRGLMDVIGATKAAEGNANMIKYFDQIMDQAVNRLGMVA